MTRRDLLTVPAGWVDLSEQGSTPATPDAGTARLYIDDDLTLRWVDDEGTVHEPAGGGGGGGAVAKIASITLDEKGTFTFDDIPQGHVDLMLTGLLRDADRTGQDFSGYEMRVGNGSVDTGSNYDWYGRNVRNGASALEAAATQETSWLVGRSMIGPGARSGAASPFKVLLPDYTNVAFERGFRSEGYASPTNSPANIRLLQAGGNWRNTSDPIDIIEVYAHDFGDFAAGSTLTLWGMG